MHPDTQLPQGFWYDTVDSTMDEARRLIASGRIRGTGFIVADTQIQGRGTHGRPWISPAEKGIYLSIVHQPIATPFFETTNMYTLAAGIACIEAIQTVTRLQLKLKPINDIYAQGKKLGGILVESDLHAQGMSCLITGIGINTDRANRTSHSNWPSSGAVQPISLAELLPPAALAHFSKEALIEAIVAKVCFWYGRLFAGQSAVIERVWNRYALSKDELFFKF